MLYRFKSTAASDIIMLASTGRQILEIIGKEASPQGVITPEQMPAAIEALQAAIAHDEAMRKGPEHELPEDAEDAHAPADENVTLRQRAAPFLDMLRQSMTASRAIVWGV